MTGTLLWIAASVAVSAMAAGGAGAAQAAKKHNQATAGGQTPSQSGVGSNHAWGSYTLVFPTVKGTAASRAKPARQLQRR